MARSTAKEEALNQAKEHCQKDDASKEAGEAKGKEAKEGHVDGDHDPDEDDNPGDRFPLGMPSRPVLHLATFRATQANIPFLPLGARGTQFLIVENCCSTMQTGTHDNRSRIGLLTVFFRRSASPPSMTDCLPILNGRGKGEQV
jgi:hypothetical protein